MQENKASAADPPQVPESGQDSSSTFLPSSKLVRSVCTSRSISIDSSRHPLSQQGKLEKLADWRIDPSWIEFPEDTREFRGGFATVSQGLLAPASLPEGDESESEHTTSQPPSSESGNPEPAKDTQEPRDDHKGKDKGVDVPTADGDNDGTEGEEKKDNEEKQKVDNQNSIQQIEYGLASSENTADGDPNSGDRDTQSRSNIQRSEDDHQGENEVTESSIPDGDNGRRVVNFRALGA
ncbi:hypothetical protein FRC01_002900 [Tulasnella sp. 417]|nr:hypothetical protein FRC01_002900 [Tulasnella sp. 417]